MKKILAICLLCLSTQLSAALSPFDQSVRELDAILHSKEIRELVPPSEQLLQATHTPCGWIIVFCGRILLVDVVYIPDGCVGPAKFKLIFKTPCKFEDACRQ